MSRTALCVALVGALTLVTPALAGSSPDARVSMTQILEKETLALYADCKKSDFKAASTRIAYRLNDDKASRWKRALNPAKPAELAAAKKLCMRVTGYPLTKGKYRVGTYQSKTESEGTWHALTFHFGERSKALFAWLKLSTGYALGDID